MDVVPPDLLARAECLLRDAMACRKSSAAADSMQAKTELEAANKLCEQALQKSQDEVRKVQDEMRKERDAKQKLQEQFFETTAALSDLRADVEQRVQTAVTKKTRNVELVERTRAETQVEAATRVAQQRYDQLLMDKCRVDGTITSLQKRVSELEAEAKTWHEQDKKMNVSGNIGARYETQVQLLLENAFGGFMTIVDVSKTGHQGDILLTSSDDIKIMIDPKARLVVKRANGGVYHAPLDKKEILKFVSYQKTLRGVRKFATMFVNSLPCVGVSS